MDNVTNAKLGEYLIGIEAKIKCPESFWPEDKVAWTVQVMDHEPSKRHQGGHKFKVVLLESTPEYEPEQETDGDLTYVAELSAKQLRMAITQQHGAGKTLAQMYDDKGRGESNLAGAALAWVMKMTASMGRPTRAVINRRENPGASGAGSLHGNGDGDDGMHRYG